MARWWLLSVCGMITATCPCDATLLLLATIVWCDCPLLWLYQHPLGIQPLQISCRRFAIWLPELELSPFINEIYFNIVIGSIHSQCRYDPYSHSKHGTTTGGLVLTERPVWVACQQTRCRRWSRFLCPSLERTLNTAARMSVCLSVRPPWLGNAKL